MDINTDILRKIIEEKVNGLKKRDLSTYDWQERIRKNDEDLQELDDEEESKAILQAIKSLIKRNREVAGSINGRIQI